MANNSWSKQISKKQLLWLGFGLLTLYVIVPQLSSFHRSLAQLRDADKSFVILSLAAVAATYLAAAGVYRFLAFHPLKYLRTVLLQLASMFANRLLPAGIGAIGTNYRYLRRSEHSPTQAGSVVAVNNLLGFFGHTVLLVLLLVFFRPQTRGAQLSQFQHDRWFLTIAAVVVGCVIIAALWHYQRPVKRVLQNVFHQLRYYREQPSRLLWALMCSILLTLCNVLALWLCVKAVHVDLSLTSIMLVFSLGVGAGTATPTPGGLGGFEAGLVGGLVIYHVPSATALAAVLAFRLVSYWLPLLVGAGAFVVAYRRQYI